MRLLVEAPQLRHLPVGHRASSAFLQPPQESPKPASTAPLQPALAQLTLKHSEHLISSFCPLPQPEITQVSRCSAPGAAERFLALAGGTAYAWAVASAVQRLCRAKGFSHPGSSLQRSKCRSWLALEVLHQLRAGSSGTDCGCTALTQPSLRMHRLYFHTTLASCHGRASAEDLAQWLLCWQSHKHTLLLGCTVQS